MATCQPAEPRRRALKLSGTPVFLYHGIARQKNLSCPSQERKYWISEEQLRRQLDAIHASNRQVIALCDLDACVDDDRDNNTVITFDDGLTSDYEIAFPVLLEKGIQAEFFINPAYVGKPRFLTWLQIAEMQRMGMSFQSHGYQHVNLAGLPVREIQRQMRISKIILEDKLGVLVDFLSLPYGGTSTKVIRIAVESGYRKICTSRNWPARPDSEIVNRVAVYSRTTLAAFERLLVGNPFGYAVRNARAAALFIPKVVRARLLPEQKTADMTGNIA